MALEAVLQIKVVEQAFKQGDRLCEFRNQRRPNFEDRIPGITSLAPRMGCPRRHYHPGRRKGRLELPHVGFIPSEAVQHNNGDYLFVFGQSHAEGQRRLIGTDINISAHGLDPGFVGRPFIYLPRISVTLNITPEQPDYDHFGIFEWVFRVWELVILVDLLREPSGCRPELPGDLRISLEPLQKRISVLLAGVGIVRGDRPTCRAASRNSRATLLAMSPRLSSIGQLGLDSGPRIHRL